jgi:hypothetical protein
MDLPDKRGQKYASGSSKDAELVRFLGVGGAVKAASWVISISVVLSVVDVTDSVSLF